LKKPPLQNKNILLYRKPVQNKLMMDLIYFFPYLNQIAILEGSIFIRRYATSPYCKIENTLSGHYKPHKPSYYHEDRLDHSPNALHKDVIMNPTTTTLADSDPHVLKTSGELQTH